MSVLPMAMALYGLAGYNNFKANQRERARQDEEDAFKREERARTRESWKAEDKLKTDVADAYAPRTTMSGTVTDTEQGKYFSSSPENAAVMQDTLSAEAELRGATAPVQQAGYAITGKMSKGHQIASGQAPAEFQDTDKDRFQRALEAYRANGQFEKAALMEKGVLELESMRIGLKTEEFDFAKKLFNLKVDQYLSDPQGWEWGLARALSDTNVSGLNGLTFTPKKSDDGKSTVLEGRDQSGKVVVEKAYPSGDQGLLKVREELTRVDPEEKIRYLNERFKAEQERADKDREYGVKLAELEIKAQEAKSKDELRASRGGGSGGGQAATTGGTSVGLKERRDMLGDYGKLLPQPDGLDPETSQKTQLANAQALEQADAIFSMNAGVGSVLTAPQIMSAQRLAQNPANVKLLRDNETGQMYQTVIVSGQPVVVGVAQQKPQQEAVPQPAQPQAPTNKPGPMTAQMQKKTQVVQPADRNEFLQMQVAMRMGYEAAGRGNAIFGNGEVLYVNKKTGERKYASQLFSK